MSDVLRLASLRVQNPLDSGFQQAWDDDFSVTSPGEFSQAARIAPKSCYNDKNWLCYVDSQGSDIAYVVAKDDEETVSMFCLGKS